MTSDICHNSQTTGALLDVVYYLPNERVILGGKILKWSMAETRPMVENTKCFHLTANLVYLLQLDESLTLNRWDHMTVLVCVISSEHTADRYWSFTISLDSGKASSTSPRLTSFSWAVIVTSVGSEKGIVVKLLTVIQQGFMCFYCDYALCPDLFQTKM